MINHRKASDRGHANHGWLDTYHTFSFADYYDPKFRGFRDLLVINDDRVGPDSGFGKHGHRDMEIVTYVLEGELKHQDSMGFTSTLKHGDVQRMSAGTGVQHSERNPSTKTPLRLLQIWMMPDKVGYQPGYEEKFFSPESKTNRLLLVVSNDGRENSVHINQDINIYASILQAGKSLEMAIKEKRHAWLQVAKGAIELNGLALGEGDGAAVSDERILRIQGQADAEFLLFDLK